MASEALEIGLGLVGRKVGMTRIFTEEGEARAVTVVEATPNRVTQVKTVPTDGYDAVQVTIGQRRANRVTKAMQGHFAKAGVEAGRGVWEFRLARPFESVSLESAAESQEENESAEASKENASSEADESKETKDAQESTESKSKDSDSDQSKGAKADVELTVTMFSQGEKVDVSGQTIGKGFAGVMKRFGFRGGRATHGNSKAHRSGGSIGNAQDPGRVFKGKKMAGHMGAKQRVQQGLEVVRIDSERNLLLISGSIPGSKGADVIIRSAAKTKSSKKSGK